jgi:hypothetical protein
MVSPTSTGSVRSSATGSSASSSSWSTARSLSTAMPETVASKLLPSQVLRLIVRGWSMT